VSVTRERQHFPTRNYPYREPTAGSAQAPDASSPIPDTLYRRVLGLDCEPRPMTADELEGLADPVGRLLRSGKPFPLTVRSLLTAIDALSGADALPDQLVFLVADGGHIPWTPETDSLRRAFRFAVARGRGDFSVLISASTALDSSSDQAFLQIIGWDAAHHVFHFYERLRGTFFWAGMSRHALDDATRGRGPFDSHVNGALVMKELRSPWIHWHAPQAGINEEAFAPDDPLRTDPLFRLRVTADRLEIEVVRPAIRRWNGARVAEAIGADGVWRNVRHFLRQAVFDTTVNLASSETASRLLRDDELLRPPLTFFINRDVLFDALGLEPADGTVSDISIEGRLYRQCLTRYDVHRTDGNIRIDGDAHFAFLVPEPAFEDTHLVEALLQAGLVSERFVGSLAMTDFSNPIFSPRRAALLRYVPEQAAGARPGDDLESRFVAAVRDAVSAGRDGASDIASPEREFLSNWDAANKVEFVRRITAYLKALQDGAMDFKVVDGWFRLAEYRRRQFRARPLSEFQLTTPRTNIPEHAPALRMNAQGRAETIPTENR